MSRLNTYVHVTAEVDGVHQSRTFGPADDLPDWAVAAITNPKVWEGEPPARTEPSAGGSEGGDAPKLEEPPRHGKGSGLEEWTAYAKSLGYEVPDGTRRDDIIAAIDSEKK